jgi:hypothetical protein
VGGNEDKKWGHDSSEEMTLQERHYEQVIILHKIYFESVFSFFSLSVVSY